MKNFSILLLLFIYSIGLSQTIIKGKITFEEEPFIMANIIIKGTNIGTVSDENGNYFLKTNLLGNYKLEISSVGFNTKVQKIDLKKAQTLEIDFQLKEVNSALEEVVVSGTMKPVKKLESPVPVEVYSTVFF